MATVRPIMERVRREVRATQIRRGQRREVGTGVSVSYRALPWLECFEQDWGRVMFVVRRAWTNSHDHPQGSSRAGETADGSAYRSAAIDWTILGSSCQREMRLAEMYQAIQIANVSIICQAASYCFLCTWPFIFCERRVESSIWHN